MRWRRLGVVFNPVERHQWMFSHASNPVAEHLEADVFKIYFSCRDRQQRSSVGYVVIDLKRPQEVLDVAESPVIEPGERGAFDDSGVSIACLLPQEDGRRFFYYLGWNLAVTVPWRNSIGLAVSAAPAAPFVKYGRAPIMDRDQEDPLTISYPWVVREGGIWRMWYGSHETWTHDGHEFLHVLKHAQSEDGIHWQRLGKVSLPLKYEDEFAISRPCIIKDEGGYRMWFSFRGSKYRIGYAESTDGIQWHRMDEVAGMPASGSGFDSDAVSYGSVFSHAGRFFMLYNGNAYGKTGFGLAELE
jgi:hypothetical protein